MNLIICVDGLGLDLVSKKNTPFIYEFGNKNSFVSLKTLFAFTGIEYSFFTGENPDKHNIWLEYCYSESSIFNNKFLKFLSFNKKLRNYFGAFLQLINGRGWMSGTYNIPKKFIGRFDTSLKEGLWKLPFFKNKKFVFYKWPFFVTSNSKECKIVFKQENDDKRLSRLLRLKDREVYYTQLLGVDKAIHKYGKSSDKTKLALRKIDKTIEKYVNSFLNENKEGKVVLWSDHGFSDIKGYIDIESYLPEINGYYYFIAGTTVHFWFDNNEVRKVIEKKLSSIRNIKIIGKKDYRKYKISNDVRYGDLVAYVEKGNYFFPNFYQEAEKERFVSMHGYPDDNELDGFLISNLKINKSLKIDDVLGFLK